MKIKKKKKGIFGFSKASSCQPQNYFFIIPLIRYDDRNYNNRYDDRRTYYNVKPLGGAYGDDRYDNKYGGYNDYRGNGYDNRDPYYMNTVRGDGYYRGGKCKNSIF